MAKSMTGFGRAKTEDKEWVQTWEVKSVNGRYLDVKWRLPHSVRSMESDFEKTVRKFATRGRVDISLHLEVADPGLLGVSLNQAQVQAMLRELEKLAKLHGVTYIPDFNKIMTMSSLWKEGDLEPPAEFTGSLRKGLSEALSSWNVSRSQEGWDLGEDVKSRLAAVRGHLSKIEELVPKVLEDKKASLRERIGTILESTNTEVQEDRLLMEVAVLTDRLDVSEELTRLAVHLDRLEEVLGGDGEVGKRLDFLLQECFREINTCGNKSQNAEVSRLAVEIKAELERCREQVQNME